MADSDALLTLQELVSVYEQRGPVSLGELRDAPALVYCGGELKGDSMGFETRAIAAPWDTRVVLAMVKSGTQVNPELIARAGIVYPVAKRPGRPFPDRIGVGRARTADLSLRSASVSKYHAYFSRSPEGHWFICDARSRNGTRTGERRIEAGQNVKLENGTQLTFGDEVFVFFTERGFRIVLDSLVLPR
jgi:hypothetical protein